MHLTLLEDVTGRPRAPGLEAVLEICIGLTALSGGLTMVFSPSGAAMGTTVALLEGTPFRSFLVPGLLLAFVIGGTNLAAAVLVVKQSRFASPASIIAGGGLIVFIVTELLLLEVFHPMQVVCLVMGVAITLLAAPKRGTS